MAMPPAMGRREEICRMRRWRRESWRRVLPYRLPGDVRASKRPRNLATQASNPESTSHQFFRSPKALVSVLRTILYNPCPVSSPQSLRIRVRILSECLRVIPPPAEDMFLPFNNLRRNHAPPCPSPEEDRETSDRRGEARA